MLLKTRRLIERQEGLKQLKEILKDKGKSLIIHYSCESFITAHGRTPRVTSISIRSMETAQVKSFSIHIQAQFDSKDFNNLSITDYDDIEKKMLDEFYNYLENNKDKKWVHWNMRDSNYGFEAIANRYKILGGIPFYLDDDRKYDCPRILGKIYTYDYETNEPKGKLLNLAKRNGISIRDTLTGKEEAEAYDNKEYLKLHGSTLKKVDIIDNIVNRAEQGSLKVNVKKMKIYGFTIPGIIELVKNNWVLTTVFSVIFFVLGSIFAPIIQRFFGTA